MNIAAQDLYFKDLNEKIKASKDTSLTISGCMGQRYIGCGLSNEYELTLSGTPGNALGAYLDGAKVEVLGNAQDATGDTMNDGMILIRGSAGDATGYGMRGGKIYIGENTGYRAGIHMKAYKDNKPLVIVGGKAGSFLGEYLAGGVIVVLGLNCEGSSPVHHFCGTGMHGGAIYIRSTMLPPGLPSQVTHRHALPEDKEVIRGHIAEYCELFNLDIEAILADNFVIVEANTKSPYKQMYTYN